MLKLDKIIYIILNIITVIVIFIIGIIYKLRSVSFFIGLNSLFLVYFGSLLFYSLFKEIKKIEYKRYQMQDYFNVLMICLFAGVLFFWFKLEGKLYIYYLIILLGIILISIFAYFYEKKALLKAKNSPKIISNKR